MLKELERVIDVLLMIFNFNLILIVGDVFLVNFNFVMMFIFGGFWCWVVVLM